MDAVTISEALRNRHSGESWAYFNELRTRTGYSGHIGYLDAYAVGLWNENRSFISYEIKVSRSDFKSDIDSFNSKQEAAIRNSTQFFYACPHGLISPNEVPEICGLMEVNSGGPRVVKVAPIRELKDGCLDIEFNRSLMRAMSCKISPKNNLWKYAGKEMTEEEILDLSKSKHKEDEGRRLALLAKNMIEDEKKKAWAILEKFARLSGYSSHALHSGEIEKVVDDLQTEFNKQRRIIGESNTILRNIHLIKIMTDNLAQEADKMINEGENKHEPN
jgi:hypothetical protein